MNWFDDEKTKNALANDEVRTRWAEEEAESYLPRLLALLPKELRQKDRLGPLSIAPLNGVAPASPNALNDTYYWMVPLDGSHTQGKILGPNLRVKLIDLEGQIFFDGLWGDTAEATIRSRERFFIWLEPPYRKR